MIRGCLWLSDLDHLVAILGVFKHTCARTHRLVAVMIQVPVSICLGTPRCLGRRLPTRDVGR
jgi:hypothetical protein